MRLFALALLTLSMAVFGSGCNQKEFDELKAENSALKDQNRALNSEGKGLRDAKSRLDFLTKNLTGIKAKIETNMGMVEVAFYPEKAPIHCFNFITRAEAGYYDNSQFHRIIPGFMIQGGDPNSKDADPNNDGQGGPIAAIPHEWNDIHHAPGILSMARVSDPSQGAGSQFFIMHGDSPQLDNQYTVFGRVTSGMDIVNKIATVQTAPGDRPVKPVIIKKITVLR